MINIWTPFTADKSILAGGASFAEGTGRGLEHLGEGIGKAIEAKKQRGQLAKSLRQTLSVAYPERKDEFATMGLPELQGTLEGEAVKSANAKAALHESLQQEQLAEVMDRRRSRAALPDLYRSLAGAGQAPEEVPSPLGNAEFDRRTRPLDSRTLFESLGRSGAPVDVRDAADLAGALERGRGDAALGEPKFYEDPVSGERFSVFGKSMASSGTNPAKVRDKTAIPKVVVSEDPITGEPRVSWTGSPDDFARQFPGARMPDVGGSSKSASSGPLPMPTDKTKLKKGQSYQTPRGVATWDGTHFTMQ